ncbi:MAG TPA: GWxTD domain-containing protein [Thermoanaerobaculia bacterium]|nr:GWxTD domain-containing protein [Thermoanaerobaculia bacterium]
MNNFRHSILSIVFLAISAPAVAESPLDFPKGPAQWLMTAEEKREWRGVKDAARAQELVDLFFVRRDPTPETFANEFRDEFRARVDFADKRFAEGRRRGSLSERGRVLVVLGFPREQGDEAAKRSAQYSSGGPNPMDPTGGREVAGRSIWTYSYEESIRFGLPKIEVVFIHDGLDGRARRDTHRNDFISALPVAIASYIKSPDLTSVPEWAKHELYYSPMTAAPREVEAMMEAPLPDAPVPAAAGSGAPTAPVTRPPSVGKLTLVADAFALEPESGIDPFASLTSRDVFRPEDELGWVAEYCSGSLAPLSAVEVTLKISGLIKGERINFNAPAEELVPDSIRASPGCYLVRGAVPLMDMEPASYALFVRIGQYNLTKDFRIIE